MKYLNERKQKQNYINSDRTFREMSTTLSSNFQYTESPMLIDHHESSTDRQVVVNTDFQSVTSRNEASCSQEVDDSNRARRFCRRTLRRWTIYHKKNC